MCPSPFTATLRCPLAPSTDPHCRTPASPSLVLWIPSSCCAVLCCAPQIVPRIKSRCYSISSSPNHTPGELRVTVGQLRYRVPDGSMRDGFCSTYLCSLKVRPTSRSWLWRPCAHPCSHVRLVCTFLAYVCYSCVRHSYHDECDGVVPAGTVSTFWTAEHCAIMGAITACNVC